jgi:hypothetical protein
MGARPLMENKVLGIYKDVILTMMGQIVFTAFWRETVKPQE